VTDLEGLHPFAQCAHFTEQGTHQLIVAQLVFPAVLPLVPVKDLRFGHRATIRSPSRRGDGSDNVQLLPESEFPEPEFPNAPVEFETYQLPFCLTSSPAVVLLSHCPLTQARMWSLASAVLDPTCEIV
jgi:hypothetical protein